MTQNTAVLVIDVQRDVVAGAHDAEGVADRIVGVVERARLAGAPVIWVQHEDDELVHGSEGWHLVPVLVPRPGESRVYKTYSDSFSGTELETVLRELGVRTVIICGAQTDFCIRNTWHSALVRGFNTVLVSDGHTTLDSEYSGVAIAAELAIAYTNMYADWGSRYPAAHGTVATAAELTFD